MFSKKPPKNPFSAETRKMTSSDPDTTRRADDAAIRSDHSTQEADSNPFAAQTRMVKPAPDTHDNRARQDAADQQNGQGKTRLMSRGASSRVGAEEVTPDVDGMLTAGWVVVVDGPGRGASRPVFFGLNSLGRGEDQTICINFGDKEVSRTHCQIAYDPRSNQFFISHGGGRNLTYLNNKPVLNTEALVDLDRIQLGTSTLIFVALCGEGFQWGDDVKPED